MRVVAGARRSRAAGAVALLLAVCTATLADALTLDAVADTTVALVAAACAGLAVGLTSTPSATAAAGALGAGLLTAANQVGRPGADSVPSDVVFYLLLLGGPAVVGALVAARGRQLAELRRLAREVEEQRDAGADAARLEQQSAVAAAVQHGVIQTMGAIVVQADGARRTADPADVRRALDAIERSARRALDELRAQVGTLREPAAVAEAAPSGGGDLPRRPRPELGPTDLLAALAGVPLAVEATLGDAARGPAWANVVAAVAVGAPLVLRRRHPAASAAAVLALAAAMSAVLTPVPATVTSLLPLLLASYAVGAHARRRRGRVTGLGVLALGVPLLSAVSPASGRDLDGLVPTLLWCLAAVGAGTAVAGRSARVARHRRLVDELEAGRDAAARLAAAQERHALARDLHDSVAAAMTVVCLHAVGARRLLEPPDVDAALATIAATARHGLAELRASLDVLDGPPEAPTADRVGDLDTVVEGARRAGVRVDLMVAGELPDHCRTLAARIVREALVNAARHAPGAHVTVTIAGSPDGVAVEVSDTGATETAPATTGTGTGLQGLAERLAAVGGRLEAGPLEPRGFVVRATMPTAVLPA
ncbi:histidine kinase [Nocardioides cheoyonin]|uniref:histidine kinase n=1 Tax=Nocardioides cheoyonin TaxID=3156615 RepID=UPI0032B4C95D